MTIRGRLSATVEPGLLAAGRQAVEQGRATSLSAWVNDALARQVAHDQRMQALDDFLDSYEAEHGAISDEEISAAGRRARSRAVVVRPPEAGSKSSARRGHGGA